MTLPGFEHHPDPAPPKTGVGYLAHLAALDYGAGWTFWSLAHVPGRARPDTEWVWLVGGPAARQACIDLTTGTVIEWGDEL